MFSEFFHRARFLLRRRSASDLDDELRFHIEHAVEANIAAGMPPEEARRQAAIAFGAAQAAREQCHQARPGAFFEILWQDLRYAARMLAKTPGFTAIAIVSLALGIGANTAIFTVAKKVLFDTLAVHDPAQLRLLSWIGGRDQPMSSTWGAYDDAPAGGKTGTTFSYPVIEQLRKVPNVFTDLIAFKDLHQLNVTVDGHPEILQGELDSGNAFSALGIEPILGRAILPADDAGPGAGPVAMISEAWWAQRFSRSPAVIGKRISVNGVPITIIGVAPAYHLGLKTSTAAQIFLPLTMQPLVVVRPEGSLLTDADTWWVLALARLAPGVSEAQAQSALDVAMRQATLATLPHARHMEGFHLRLLPGNRGLDPLRREFSRPSYVLLALAGFVLLLACVNLANLLLARSAARQREMSTRLALGATRSRILRQVLTESLLLSMAGGAAGLLLGYFTRNVIPSLLEDPWQPNHLILNFDWRVLAFTLAITLATGVLFGILPAWQATRVNVNAALKDVSHSTLTRQRLWMGKTLIIVQVALSTVLLVGAGLFVRTLINLSRAPLGFHPDHILLFDLNPPRSHYTDQQILRLYEQLEEKLAALPGVKAETVSSEPLIANDRWTTGFHIAGRQPDRERDHAWANSVGVDFFSTMGIPLLTGRSFTAQDTATSPKVAVVNQALVRKFFPGGDPIGQTFNDEHIQIIGVVADAKFFDVRSDPPPTYYMDYRQWLDRARGISFEIRTAADPSSVLQQVRAAVESLDHDLPLVDVRTQTEQVAATMSGPRLFAQLTGGFGLLALVLASIGIYGVMAYTVARRISEIGIRMALGAQARQVLAMVLREASWLAIAGVVAGAAAALLLTRLVGSMLYGLSASDPVTFAAAACLLIAIALLAGFAPARRASRVDPMQALRHE
jgi:predicted permease